MPQLYSTVGAYVYSTRVRLQDLIYPFRYSDNAVIAALNSALFDVQRIRPDIFLDLKYQRPLIKGDIGDGSPSNFYTTNDVKYQAPPNNNMVDPTQGTYVAIPSKLSEPVVWYMAGQCQLFDVNDTTDQRAQAFFTKFQQELLSVAA